MQRPHLSSVRLTAMESEFGVNQSGARTPSAVMEMTEPPPSLGVFWSWHEAESLQGNK